MPQREADTGGGDVSQSSPPGPPLPPQAWPSPWGGPSLCGVLGWPLGAWLLSGGSRTL